MQKALGREEATKIKSIIENIEKDPRSYDFLIPVDYIGFGLTDYPAIIKKPMDLGTLKKNLKDNKYSTVDEALADLQLIWTNCKTYNMEGSEIWKLAHQLEKTSQRLVEKAFKPGKETKKQVVKEGSAKEGDDDQTEDNKKNLNVLNVQEKIQLTEKVRKLSNEGLSAFVKLVQKDCPTAFEDLDAEKVQIRVDYLDRSTYNQLLILVDHYLKQD